MKKVYISYDVDNDTWNVMLDKRCLYYTSDVREIDIWLRENESKYYEG